MYCPKCGNKTMAQNKFCAVCGAQNPNYHLQSFSPQNVQQNFAEATKPNQHVGELAHLNQNAQIKREVNTEYANVKTPKKRKKSRNIMTIFACIIALFVILVTVFFIKKAQMPWFELNNAGVLRFDSDSWKFYHFYSSPSVVEIPRAFDGEIKKIASGQKIYQQLRYEGTLEDFIEYHSWVFDMMQDIGGITVKCADYTFKYNSGGLGMSINYSDDGAIRMVEGCYEVYTKNDSILFKSLGELHYWLSTGMIGDNKYTLD